jgi:ribosomal 50S subunit-associated protein YjgA (DUF615 family)
MRYLDEEEKRLRPSKTQLKKLASETTKFIDDLLSLSPNQISQIGLPDEVFKEILLAKKQKASTGRNRSVKYISGILRDDEIWGTSSAIKQFPKIAAGKAKLKIEQ